MKLVELLAGFFWFCLSGSLDVDIEAIYDDSRKAVKGGLFVCIEGSSADGHSKIQEAVDKGAQVLVVNRPVSCQSAGPLTVIQTPDTRLALAKISQNFYGNPSAKLKTIGITGTKGKTTTAYMLRQILTEAGYKVGMMGTIENFDGKTHDEAKNTTPGAIDIARYMASMVHNGMDYVIMEVSSQGLKQNRTAGINFDIGIITNIFQDHIGKNEHATMEEYIFCKGLLFKQCQLGIANASDKNVAEAIKNHLCRMRYFSGQCAESCADDTEIDFEACEAENTPGRHTCYTLREKHGREIPLEINMPGAFNVLNSLAAASAALCLHIPEHFIKTALTHVYVKGRMEILPGFKDFTVMIDYAHNAAALESLLTELRKSYGGRIICMFGCGGNRARQRRTQMGIVSGAMSDLTVVTSDNPRYEDPALIMEDIISGLKLSGGRYIAIEKREEAIDFCLKEAKSGDIVVLAGKGHENYQEIKGVKKHLDEREYILSRQADKSA